MFPSSVTLPVITKSWKCIAKVPLHPPIVTLYCKATASLIYTGSSEPASPKTIDPESFLPAVQSAFDNWTFDEMGREEDEYDEWKTVEKVVEIGEWKVVFRYHGPNKDPVEEKKKGNDGRNEAVGFLRDLHRLQKGLVERGEILAGLNGLLDWIAAYPDWREGVRRERERCSEEE